jgi:hypothetical protein
MPRRRSGTTPRNPKRPRSTGSRARPSASRTTSRRSSRCAKGGRARRDCLDVICSALSLSFSVVDKVLGPLRSGRLFVAAQPPSRRRLAATSRGSPRSLPAVSPSTSTYKPLDRQQMLAASPLLRAARPIVRLRLGRPSSSTTTSTPPPPRANPAVPARRPTEPRTVSSVRSPSSTPKASAKVDSDYSPFLLLLAAVPVTCAYLAYWQVGRLKWKVELIEELELNLGRKAINLPDEIECVQLV